MNSSVNLCDINEYTPLHAACINGNIAVWETTACQLAKGEWKFQVASKIHFILAGLASNTCNYLIYINFKSHHIYL
jgi:ankyrin repeat protein